MLFLTLLSAGTLGELGEDQLISTKLKVTVIDGLGNFVEGATVAIYDNEEDYVASTNAVAMLKTDEKGKVIFKRLMPISYFIQASYKDKKNDGEGVVTSPLTKWRLNKVNTVIQ